MIVNLEGLKARIDIVEVIGKFIPLKKEGANWSACCPFHEEKSPSFKVNPNKQIYHCFGCNAGGDAIKFYQEFKHCNFQEAVQEIADMLGYSLEIKGGVDLNKYFELLGKVNGIFTEELKTQSNVLKYLFNRGLNADDLALFDIGYIPKDLPKHLSLQECEALEELGLLFKNKGGGFFVPLQNRISFAMRNFTHKVVGFSGRTHPYSNFKNSAKYINSKESRLFHKSQLLYGISLAKRHISSQKECFIVEGFMDVIAMHKLGFKNTIATCGTAFNTQHLSAINRVCDGVVIKCCFDKDAAGQKAALKASELLYNQGFLNAEVVRVKEECKDIGELLEKGIKSSFESVGVLEFFIAQTLENAQDIKAKDAFINKIRAEISAQKNFYQKSLMVETLKKLGIPFEAAKKVSKVQKQNSQLPFLSLLKTCIYDERVLDLCANYLEPVEFGAFKEDFIALLRKESTQNLNKLSLDEKIDVVAFGDVRFMIFELKRRFLEWQLKDAKLKGDAQALLLLSQQLAQITEIKPS
ncbi:DNA primase [Helicobacter sp. MIT 11-5569]|uniref:DNA primase n=1 Tax=Helicobacter sp. MIT 11-5569 TaxID=1548151 RepID=UPI00051FBB84|nr:DNA primase [Helicobacter sp. MIT 11-5569]TLD83942.1 DNA primase [Helicobacter sp. MIT 11-5569]